MCWEQRIWWDSKDGDDQRGWEDAMGSGGMSSRERGGQSGGPLTSVSVSWWESSLPCRALSCATVLSQGSEEAGFFQTARGLVIRLWPKEWWVREFKALGQVEQQAMKSKLVLGEVKRLEVFAEEPGVRAPKWPKRCCLDDTWQERGSFDKSRGIWASDLGEMERFCFLTRPTCSEPGWRHSRNASSPWERGQHLCSSLSQNWAQSGDEEASSRSGQWLPR